MTTTFAKMDIIKAVEALAVEARRRIDRRDTTSEDLLNLVLTMRCAAETIKELENVD